MTKANVFEWCAQRYGRRFSTGKSVRDLHGRDQSGCYGFLRGNFRDKLLVIEWHSKAWLILSRDGASTV
mgnify:CR=1 FL=1